VDLYICEVKDNGQMISLSDGTQWRVGEDDAIWTIVWDPAQYVEIENDGRGPSRLMTNLDTARRESVRAWPA
jgi:hypothetical protein